MKTIYLECNMGASGDMLMASLLELYGDQETFLRTMNGLGLPGVEVRSEPSQKCGITGTHIRVLIGGAEERSGDIHEHGHPHGHEHLHSHEHPHGHAIPHPHETGAHAHTHVHSGYQDICALIMGLALPQRVRKNACAVYRLIGEAEAHAHGVPVEQVHFHEVGTIDAVVDVVGCCLLFDLIGAGRITASPIHVGFGEVRCAHGVLPVPAPATAHILRGVPIYGGSVRGELCTPTGAALLRHFASEFGPMPPMAVERIGYGMGTKDFDRANCVRAFLGESSSLRAQICELCCNIDDMTPEALGFAQEILFENGALDVFLTPVQMKKSRPGVLLTCLCAPDKKDELARHILLHTSTRGVRERLCERVMLSAETTQVETPYGPVHIKISSGNGVRKEKPEYDDVRAAARMHDVPFDTVYQAALDAYKEIFR